MSDSNLPLVSVVMCTYNGEKHLADQLNSLLSQTYKNIEIVIVDDCSSDSTGFILGEYQKQYPSIRLFFNKTNLGFNKNFEKAIGLSKGEYISICDQDDVWDVEKIEKLKLHIGSKGMVFSNSRLMDETGLPTGRLLLESNRSTKFDYRSILINNYVTGHTILARTSFLQRTLPFPKDGYYDWWIGFVACYNSEITYFNEALTGYRVHSNSVIQKEISLSMDNPLGFSIIDYKSTKLQLENFYIYLQKQPNHNFILKLTSFYSERTSALDRLKILFFLFYHYNLLFPLHIQRKLTSTTRFKFVKRYWNDVLKCKHHVLGFI